MKGGPRTWDRARPRPASFEGADDLSQYLDANALRVAGRAACPPAVLIPEKQPKYAKITKKPAAREHEDAKGFAA